MTHTQHTPGPWLAGQNVTAPHPDRPERSYERTTVAQRVNRAADMHLIAAAPELLQALVGSVQRYDAGAGMGVEIEDARAAIRKATNS